jgi:hypothetical protein
MKIRALAEMLGRQDVDGLRIRLGLSPRRDVKIVDNKTGRETVRYTRESLPLHPPIRRIFFFQSK